jgi:GNAT superfamily N-acetyltransferase
MSTPAAKRAAVQLRRATADDAAAAGRICYEAFAAIAGTHGFPPDFPHQDVAVGLLGMLFTHPGFYGVVAEADGRIVGSNCLDERGAIAGVGPITVDPGMQNGSIGRMLMQAVLDRARERQAAGVRLLQAAYHSRSLSLYSKLGFDAREPMSVMQGPSLDLAVSGYAVRAATEADLAPTTALCMRVHGHSREGELRDAVPQGGARVVEREGRITGYASGFGFFGHAIAETNGDLQALIGAADHVVGPGFIVPTRNGELFRWCVAHGLRVVMPLTLMTIGLYNEPRGAYLPSILY